VDLPVLAFNDEIDPFWPLCCASTMAKNELFAEGGPATNPLQNNGDQPTRTS